MYILNLHNPIQVVNASLANRQHKIVNIHEFTDVDWVKFLHDALGGPLLSTVK